MPEIAIGRLLNSAGHWTPDRALRDLPEGDAAVAAARAGWPIPAPSPTSTP